MKTLCLSISLLIITNYVLCQTPQKIIIDNNKASVSEINPELQQIFPDFRNGSIHYKNKRPIECKLNYNFFLDEMLFLNEKGDKMAIANPQDLSYVLIDNRMFISTPEGYFEVIEDGNISLVYKWISRISKAGKEGALGISTDAPSVYQMNRMSFDSKEWKMGVNEEAVVSVEVRPFLWTKSKLILIKGPKSYYKAFHNKSSEIKKYLDQNPADFRKEEDLRRITRYCNSL